MKKIDYISPTVETFVLTTRSSMMLEFSVFGESDEMESKEQSTFEEEEEAVPTAPNFWGDTEGED